MAAGAAAAAASERADRVMDAFALSLNMASSVLIIFVNKKLMDPVHGCGFMFATTLCALHFFTSGLYMKGVELAGYSEAKSMPLIDSLWFAVVASTSVASMNLSLLLNSVGFYQITKLMIIPTVGLIEFVWLGKQLTLPVMGAILLVVSGVGVVTVSDVTINTAGLVMAAVAILSSAMQQVSCGYVQKKCGISSNQLLSNSAPWLSLLLISVGPYVDFRLSHLWVLDYRFEGWAATLLLLTCAIAVLVNVSQFLCLGRFRAVTFTVLGHGKTMLVLLFGWLWLGEVMTPRKLFGMTMAIVGMVLFGWLQSNAAPAPAPAAASSSSPDKRAAAGGGRPGGEEQLPLLADVEKGVGRR